MAPLWIWRLRLEIWRMRRMDPSLRGFTLAIRLHPTVKFSDVITVPAFWQYVNVVPLNGSTAVRSIGAVKTISLPDAIAIAKDQALDILQGADMHTEQRIG